MKPQHSLSDEQIDQYRNEGFVVVERLFNADDLARVDATVRQMTDQALAGGDFSKVLELEPEPVDGKRVPGAFSILTISTKRFVRWPRIRVCSTKSNRSSAAISTCNTVSST
jgi:hypothetical protein